MRYDRELRFAEELLKNHNVRIRYIDDSGEELTPGPPIGLRSILNYSEDLLELYEILNEHCRPNTFYQVTNSLLCEYIIFRLPDLEKTLFACIGPFTTRPIPRQDILKLADHFQVAPGNLNQLEQFYQNLPLFATENTLLPIIYTLGTCMWGSADNFSLSGNVDLFQGTPDVFMPLPDISTPEEALLSMQILENRYEAEHQLAHAVANGQMHKAELCFENLSSRQYSQRGGTPLRSLKNYAFALNTVLRIAAENGAVHPIHIDEISTRYAQRIETIASEAACQSLMREMVRKYCILVKNHSLKGYSLLVRKVVTRIDTDLTADLSLKAQAELLNVNSSYLSTLFKKETGTTLTEYVNRKRIDHALLLLNSTNMQIHLIAQYCGIPDVNYFTKTFKKIIGKTPREYRESVTPHL